MRARRVRALARLTCLLSLLVVGLSAALRLAGADLGCAEWPACYGRVLSGEAPAAWPAARLAHRLIATLALLSAALLVWRCWRPRPLQPAARYASLLLALMLLLAVVGVRSGDPTRVWVNLVNLLGGLGLVSFAWRVSITADASALIERGAPGPVCRGALAVLTLAVLFGALIGARYAATACATVPDCAGVWWPPVAGWAALNPFGVLAGPAAPGETGGVALHLLHRYAAVLAVALFAVVALRLRRVPHARRAVRVVLALCVVECALGVLTVASGYSLWLAIAHNVGAALLLAAAASLMHAVRR